MRAEERPDELRVERNGRDPFPPLLFPLFFPEERRDLQQKQLFKSDGLFGLFQ
jgi:hypothetical protein